MLANIISHSKQNDTTTTLKFGERTLAKNVVLDIEDITDGDIINDTTLHQTLARVKTPFLLGFPYIEYPATDQLVTATTIFQASTPILNDAVVGVTQTSRWQVSDREDFSNILFDRTYTPDACPEGNITKFDPKNIVVRSGFYYVRMRYMLAKITSPWSLPLRINMPSLKVAIPTITMEERELTPIFRVTAYTLTPEFIAQEGNDQLKEVIWGLTSVPESADTEYMDQLLSRDFVPDYTYKKVFGETDQYSMTFPFTDVSSGSQVRLTAGNKYLITCTLIGNKYTSIISGKIFRAGEYRVLPPKFTIRQFELKPEITILPFEITGGQDELEKYKITVFEQTDHGPVVVHTIATPAQFYNVPEGVCEPNTTYDFSIVAVGKKYGPSQASVLSMTMPSTGIRAPRLNISNRGMEPYITLSPFETINSGDTMRGTEWELYNHANVEGNRLINRWVKENADTFLRIEKAYIETNTNYKIRVRYLGHKYKSPWVEEAFKTINIVVSKPTVTATALGLTVTADISGYNVTGDIDSPDKVVWTVQEVRVVIPTDPNEPETEEIVSTLIDGKVVPWTEKRLKLTPKEGIKKNTRYKITGRILGVNYVSPDSLPAYITTPNIFIVKPTVTVTGEPNNVPKFPTFTASPFETNMETDTHVSTTWRLTDGGGNEIFESVEDKTNLTNYIILEDLLQPSTDYVLYVTYHGEIYGSSDTRVVNFRTRNNFIEVPLDGENDVVIVGDDSRNETTKYYGTFPFAKLNGTRQYLGNWDGSYEYPADSQVLHKGRLWYAQDTSSFTNNGWHLNLNREPGAIELNGITYWKEDDRNVFPTFHWLLKQIGFQANIKDMNGTKVTTGNLFRGEYFKKDSVGLSKYMIGMKILYIYDDTELINVSRNDLALVGLLGKGRTIRIGERLYWLRIPTVAEHRELHRFTTIEDTGSVVPYNRNSDVWLSDDPKEEDYGYYGQDNGEPNLDNANKRRYGLRLVLEYIPQYEEPWLFARKKYPTLQYDRYTDTGYFGTVDTQRFNFQLAIGLVTGTKINKDVSMLAFYEHGRRILVNRMPISYGISFKQLLDLQCIFGPDVKLPNYTGITIDNFASDSKKYKVRLLRGGFLYADLPEIEHLNSDVLLAANNFFKGSEWNELIYRVALHTPKHVDVNPFHGGWQIGKNWDQFDNINLGVFEHYSGNGCHDFVLSFVSDERILSRGGTKLEATYYVKQDEVRNDHGVRLVLEETEVFSKNSI